MSEKDLEVVIVGSVGLDTIETATDRRDEILGGSASYACAAASFFSRVGMVGIVGTDFPKSWMDLYHKLKIDLAGLQVVEGKTFRWSGVYEKDMNNRNTISTDLNVFADFTPELPKAYRKAPYLLLGNISPELQLHVLEQAENPRFVVADTMDLWINFARDALTEVIGKVDMITLNESEARHYTGKDNLIAAAGALLDLGPTHVLIKKGEHGSLMFTRLTTFVMPAFPLEHVIDPTGAGDSFAGGFNGALASLQEVSEGTLRQAMVYGNIIASFGVESFSLEKLETLERTDIEERVGWFRQMTHIP